MDSGDTANMSRCLDTLGTLDLIFRILDFLPVRQQLQMAQCPVHILRKVPPDSLCWSRLSESMCREFQLFLPSDAQKCARLAAAYGNWRAVFEDLWRLRSQFTVGVQSNVVEPGTSQRLRLATYARMRPLPAGKEDQLIEEDPVAKGPAVALPLHQRVALLRESHPELSAADALRRVFAGCSGVSRADSKVKSSSSIEASADSVEQSGAVDGFRSSVLSVQSGSSGSILTVGPTCGLRAFEFHHVFGVDATQHDLYNRCGLRLVNDMMNGVNGAIILYGQTGSGKTYTMFGPDGVGPGDESQGLAVRVASDLIDAVCQRRAEGVHVELSVSYIEIFGNDINDLLSDIPDIYPQQTRSRHLLEGDLGHEVVDFASLLALLSLGDERKRKASTAMNERSTRAHSIVMLRLVQHTRQQIDAEDTPTSSVLFLADLGGSERLTKSKANEDLRAPGGFVTNNEDVPGVSWDEYYRSRQRITETCNINKGLLSLKRCIHALVERQCGPKASVPIPFFDNKLTIVLKPALGGLARTAIVVCCSSEPTHAEETVQSLRFGEQCGQVEHTQRRVSNTSQVVARALRQLDADIAQVELAIARKERWEWRDTVHEHIVDASTAAGSVLLADERTELGGMGAVEFVPTQKERRVIQHTVRGEHLVGAEAERVKLEALLDQRRKLLGD